MFQNNSPSGKLEHVYVNIKWLRLFWDTQYIWTQGYNLHFFWPIENCWDGEVFSSETSVPCGSLAL